MATNVLTEMHCIVDNKIKVTPGSTYTLTQEINLPSGTYILVLEDHKKESFVRSHVVTKGDVLVTSKDGNELLRSEVDFHREHPFVREIIASSFDGASEGEFISYIKLQITLTSHAHIKKARISSKLLSRKENVQVAIINSQTTEAKKNGRVRATSATNSPDFLSFLANYSSTTPMGSARSTPSNSFTDLPQIPVGYTSSDSNSSSPVVVSPPLSTSPIPISSPSTSSSSTSTTRYRDEEEMDPPRAEKTISEKSIIEVPVLPPDKDVVVIKKDTMYTIESESGGTTTQIHVEQTKVISTETNANDSTSEKGRASSFSDRISDVETSSSYLSSGFDLTEENLVYYKEIKLRKKTPHTEKTPIQQKGRYYLEIENVDRKPIARNFSCHLILSTSTGNFIKESFLNASKRKICDDFIVESDSSVLSLVLANTSSFGSADLQISLYLKPTASPEEQEAALHPHLRRGEIVWAVSKCEVEKKHPHKYTTKIPTSGKYYIVVEKVDKMYGGLREIGVTAKLTEPTNTVGGVVGTTVTVASVVVGGIKARPMKWKSPIFVAPAESVLEFLVESYAIVGSVHYSIRLRKVPGLTAEEERTRKMVVLFLSTFGIYYLLYLVLSVMHFLQNLGFTIPLLIISVDITIGRICLVLFALWCRENKAVLIPFAKDMIESVRKIVRKLKYIRDMSDGGKFDILRIFKQMSKEGKQNDLRKWERQKLQTANE